MDNETWVSQQALGIQNDDQARRDAANASRVDAREVPGRWIGKLRHGQRTDGWTTGDEQADVAAAVRHQRDTRGRAVCWQAEQRP